jgi:hypothetical protein
VPLDELDPLLLDDESLDPLLLFELAWFAAAAAA